MPGPRHAPSSFDAWSVPGALPHSTEILDVGAAPDGLVVRRPLLQRQGAEDLLLRLRDGRDVLLERPARELARILGRAGERFGRDGDVLREEALGLLPASAALSAPMARAVLDGMARDWTEARLLELLDAELAGGSALDGFIPDAGRRQVRALGRPLQLHVSSGTVPGVSVTSLLRGLLVKSAVLLKPGRGDEVLPVLFRRALEEEDDGVAAAAAVVYWPGGAMEPLESLALQRADLVVVYGDEDSVAEVRQKARPTTPVVAYPHRVSFAVVGGDALGMRLSETARDAARAVSLFEQRGCVSPHLVYVLGGEGEASDFAEALATSLAETERELPAAPPAHALASRLHQLRGAAELAEAGGRGRMWSGPGASWTVVLEPDSEFDPSCLGRFVRVKPAASVEAVVEAVRPYRRYLQTVGVAGLGASLPELAEALARAGAVRITPLGSAPWPPAWWHHDGGGPLGALVSWTDLEG